MRNRMPVLVVNPKAGRVRRKFLEKHRFWEELLPPENVCCGREACRLDDFLERARAMGVREVAVLGGDGTLHLVATAIARTWPQPWPAMIPLNGGTVNAVCHDMGVLTDPEASLRAVVRSAAGAGAFDRRPKRLLHVVEHGGRDHYGFTFANGVFYNAFADYYRREDPVAADAVRVTAVSLLSGLLPEDSPHNRLRPISARVSSHGEVWVDGKVGVVVASVLDNPLLWFKPFRTPLNGKGAFNYLVNFMGTKGMVLNAWPLMKGRLNHPQHMVGQIDQLESLASDGYILDGEVYELDRETLVTITPAPEMVFLSC